MKSLRPIKSLLRAAPMWLMLIGVGCLGATWGCSILFSYDDYAGSRPSPPGSDAGTVDAADKDVVTVDEAGIDNCGRFVVPSKPKEDPGGADADFLFALDSLRFDLASADPAAPLGPDLDGVCSCAENCACPGPPSCKGKEAKSCDKRGGVDNGGGDAVSGVFTLRGSGRPETERIAAGSSTIAFRLTNYNGKPNDPQVGVHLFRVGSIGQPKWDGSDAREPESDTIVQTDPVFAQITQGDAYVKDGYLVTKLSGSIPFDEILLPFSEILVIAKLSDVTMAPPKLKVARGYLAGRVPTAQLLNNFRTIPSSEGDGGLCNDVKFGLARGLICEARDIMGASGQDNKDMDCDAMGVAWQFTAAPIRIGPVSKSKPRKDFCPNIDTKCPK
jgi:hypothetical protein